MSSHPAVAHLDTASHPRRIAVLRATVALVWAAVVAIAAGDAGTDLSAGLALLLTAYPVIDVVASLAEAAQGGEAANRLRINAALSGIAVAGLAVAAFGSDVSSVLAVFGSWAVVSGLIQLFNATQRRRNGSREIPMLVSGGLSAIAGASIIASSGADDPSLTTLAGYATLGAVLFLVWALRSRTSS
ncbi:MAG: hypothetical protein JWQ18_2815 [Conexibacter sp.]|nr:hypothetical protein [Conexibacter sp.]